MNIFLRPALSFTGNWGSYKRSRVLAAPCVCGRSYDLKKDSTDLHAVQGSWFSGSGLLHNLVAASPDPFR